MRPVRIEWENIRRYHGKHALDLDRGVYAVIAEHADDEERSNWLGKSTLLELFSIALYGWHSSPTEDDLATRTTAHWSVRLTLDDGTIIERTRKVGKTTQIHVTTGRPVCNVRQQAAQDYIEKHLGLGRDDFLATCFIRQKQVAEFVTTTGAGRQAIVEGWLAEELRPLQEWEAKILALVANNLALVDDLAREQVQIDRRVDELRVEFGWDSGTDVVADLQHRITEAESRQEYLKKAIQEQSVAEVARKAAEDIENQLRLVVQQGKEERAELDALPVPEDLGAMEQRQQLLTREATVLREELTDLLVQYKGRWDGRCPMTKEECPSEKWVNARRPADSTVEALEKRVQAAEEEAQSASDAIRGGWSVRRARERLEGRLEGLRAERDRLLVRRTEVAAGNIDVPRGMALLTRELAEVAGTASRLRSVEKEVGVILARMRTLETEQNEAIQGLSDARVAARLFGKTGAQRVVVERSLLAVEAGANAKLMAAGIPLTTRLRWERPGKGLAEVCEVCGTAFPKSTKVRTCSCSANRGPKVVRGFHVEVSDVSGAADDLAGLAVCLSASEWLRARRGSTWSALFLDEPFGSLDVSNRRALAAHVAGILSTFDLALVVAHDRSVLDTLPRKIKIRGSESRSAIGSVV